MIKHLIEVTVSSTTGSSKTGRTLVDSAAEYFAGRKADHEGHFTITTETEDLLILEQTNGNGAGYRYEVLGIVPA